MSTIVETSFFGNLKQSDSPKISIIPVPYEYTTSYQKGTKNGPQAILNASIHLSFFDEEIWTDISRLGINTTDFVNCEFVTNKTKEPFIELEQMIRDTIISGSIPVTLGGEPSISYGAIKAVNDLYPDVSILYLSSRPNLLESYQNNRFNNLCALRQICENIPEIKITQVGIKSISQEEADWLEQNDTNIEIYFAKDIKQWKTADILSNLTKNVYISCNLNVLDPGIMPSSMLPEPGGLNWERILDVVKNVCAFKEIVGMDFVGLSPITGLNAPNLLAAKLVNKFIAYTFARQLGAFEEEASLVSQES